MKEEKIPPKKKPKQPKVIIRRFALGGDPFSVKGKMWRPIKEEEAPKERPNTMMICAQKRPFWYSSSSSFWVVHTSNKNVASHMIKGRRENTWPKKIVEDDGLGKKNLSPPPPGFFFGNLQWGPWLNFNIGALNGTTTKMKWKEHNYDDNRLSKICGILVIGVLCLLLFFNFRAALSLSFFTIVLIWPAIIMFLFP